MDRDPGANPSAESLEDWAVRYFATNLWRIADRAFKLVGWAVLIAGIVIFAQKSGSPTLDTIAYVLIGLWFVALLHQLIRFGFDIQDAIAERMRGTYPRWLFVVVAAVISMGFIVVLIRVVLPAIGHALGELLDAAIIGS